MSDSIQRPPHRHWGDAAFHWQHYGSPLRPNAADVAAMEAIVAAHHRARRAATTRALLLGVTPEIATMAWPEGTQLTAVDRSPAMIEHVWPGDIAGQRRVVQADWFDFVAGSGPVDVVILDGGFGLLDFPRQYRALAAIIHAALAPDGRLVTRLFLQSAHAQTPEQVFADLLANRIESFHAFKFRLALAMQRDAATGVRMGTLYEAWEQAAIDRASLCASTGWPREVLETIRPWEAKESRLTFPSATEMASVMDELFVVDDARRLDYELADCCPIVSYRPQPR